MRWSKLKQQVEEHFAASVHGRVELRSTRYRESHDREGRVWITLDGKEIYDFCTWRAIIAGNRLMAELRDISGNQDYRDPEQRAGYYLAQAQAKDINHRQGIYNQYEVYAALEGFLSLPIDAILSSDNLVVRALGLLDRRVGKRRLRAMILSSSEHELLRRLYVFRCTVERVRPRLPAA